MPLHLLRRRTALLGACATLLLAPLLAATPLAADENPTPAEIIARFVEGLGGEDALRARTSATMKGPMEIPAVGLTGDATIYTMAPDKYLETAAIPGFGDQIRGFNGKIGWQEDPMQGAQVLDGEMLKQAARNARFYSELEYDELYPEQTVAGKVDWNGQSAWQLDLVDQDGGEHTHYFSEDTGLLVGMEMTLTSEMGSADATINTGEYKDFGGVMAPSRVIVAIMGMEIIQTMESVTWNDVDESVFEPSDAIKALLPE